ncbi:MAG: phosphoribosyltransferase family protein [Ferruginibacter sp.]
MNSKPMEEVKDKIRSMDFKESFDLIVAIANGGIIPATMLSNFLQVKLELLKINYRDINQRPIYESPQLLTEIDFDITGKTILLVEDRVKTGATLQYAKQLLSGAALVKTFAVNGPADYFLYDEACFSFPWNMGIKQPVAKV